MGTGVYGIKVRRSIRWFLMELSLSLAVVFRMVVFRPFAGEVILAKAKSSDEEGIRRMWLRVNLHGLHTQL